MRGLDLTFTRSRTRSRHSRHHGFRRGLHAAFAHRRRTALDLFIVTVGATAAVLAVLSLPGPVPAFAQPAAPAPPPVPGGPPAQSRFSIHTERGFIDDPFALSPKSRSLAILLTDAASFARVDIIDLETGRPRRNLALGDPQRVFERVFFAEDGAGIVLLSRDAGSGRRSAQYFDGNGKPAGIVGPASDFGVVTRDGERFLIGVTQTTVPAGVAFNISRYRLAGLGRVGKSRTLVVTKSDELRAPPLKSVSWQDGHAVIVGLAPGGYDKARDVRVPDQGAAYDVLAGNFTWKGQISDVVAWATATELRHKFDGRSLFAVLAADANSFELVDWLGRRGSLDLPVPLRYYDPSSLVELEDPATPSLFFSLAIDPLHPEALARRKKDPSYLDIYWARPAALKPNQAVGKDPLRPAVTRLLRALVDDRPTTWLAAGSYAAVLRKHKNFSRGGNLLEVFPLEATVPE
jgi:hypothetical protein